jgi:hypothetical protein
MSATRWCKNNFAMRTTAEDFVVWGVSNDTDANPTGLKN